MMPLLRTSNVLLLTTMAWAATACTSPPAPDDTIIPGPSTVATYDGGEITAEELDQEILTLPPTARQSLGSSGTETYVDLVREMVATRIFLSEARAIGLAESPKVAEELRTLERSAFVEQYLRSHLPLIEPPTVHDLEERFETEKDSYLRDERRFVFNIFLHRSADTTTEALRTETEELRQRVLDGEGFSTLAAQVSDSESRHRGGVIGWISRGDLSADLEDVIFGLDEGVPSKPILTRDGAHLFYVDIAIGGSDLSLDELRRTISGRILAERREEALVTLEADLEMPPDSFVPEREELMALVRAGKLQAVALRVGEHEVRVGTYITLVSEEQRRTEGHNFGRDPAIDAWNQLRRSELIYHHSLAQNTSLDPATSKALRRQTERLLADTFRDLALERELDEISDQLQAFHNDNRLRFVTPLRVTVTRLSVPLGNSSGSQMAELESSLPALNEGRTDLDQIGARMGGSVEEVAGKTLAALTALEPKMAFFSSNLEVGKHSPPYRTLETLEMLQMVQRAEPTPLSFDRVRPAVRSAYLQRHGQVLYKQLLEGTLEAVHFRIAKDRLQRLREPATVRPETE